METFFGKLERFVNSEALGASKRPMIEAESADDAWFDVEISRSLRAMIAPVTAAVKGETGAQMQSAVPASDATVNYHDQVVQQYKEMIRSQDEELRRAKAEITRLQATTEASPTPPADAAGATVLSTPDPAFGRQLAAAEEEVASLQAQVTELTQERDLARVEAAAAAAAPPPSTPEGSNGTEAALADMQSSLNAAHADMQELYNQNEALRSRVQELESLAASATEHAAADKSALERKLAAKMDEFEVVNKEHEDMLILLAQQHQKLARYTEKLLAFGSELTESEEEGESSSEVESEVGEIESEVESELGKIE
jgi:DNA repair exonuclease SbcCD ATPase subunit